MRINVKSSALSFLVVFLGGCVSFSPSQPGSGSNQKTTPLPSRQEIQVPDSTTLPDNIVPGPEKPKRRESAREKALRTSFQKQAAGLIKEARYDEASDLLERGLRIVPKNAMLWSLLAEVKLLQHNYPQARSLAAKSNSLAAGNREILNRNRQILAEMK